MFGLGKKRSKFGKFMDRHGIIQEELSKASGVNRNSISRAAKEDDQQPSMKNASKIIKALKRSGYDVDYDDFWSM
ncbi:helix-turn-helix domain-containing protein [Pseudogracilibacillus auburnensis]|uniref:helix-turn-helix domain-containing protein n=1 Tax=Pseudogracilibacillus auburnensis TaxID=1494959 RepID=UPI001A96A45C|nr:helix-turn-helix transcriptional regulator [Pseudogracilibacillus auburnensis]MBO1005771.1 helix-turn-helix transcriptional regulator [Pseudogracilibacillus auburnensis]